MNGAMGGSKGFLGWRCVKAYCLGRRLREVYEALDEMFNVSTHGVW